jgi:hypothetical protein
MALTEPHGPDTAFLQVLLGHCYCAYCAWHGCRQVDQFLRPDTKSIN